MHSQDDPYASYKLLKNEFLKKGYAVDEELVDSHLFVTYKSPSGGVWHTSSALLQYPCISESVREISRHKERAYAYVEQRGVSAPYTYVLQPDAEITEAKAAELFASYSKLIVKPSQASLSKGLTVNIVDYGMLMDGIRFAREIADTVLIQQQVEGEEVRFTVIDGKVEAALLRQTPRVIGDGHSTLKELIIAENNIRKTLLFPYISYPQLDASIVPAEYLTSNRVLEEDEVFELNRATMVKNGCSIYNLVEEVHSSYIKTVESLVGDLDARFVVVDMFLKDYRSPQNDGNYWFIEFNTSPVLKMYYACRDGKMFDIAPRLADSIDKGLRQQKA